MTRDAKKARARSDPASVGIDIVRRILRLPPLKPDTVEAVLRGTETRGLSLERLVKALPVGRVEPRAGPGFPMTKTATKTAPTLPL